MSDIIIPGVTSKINSDKMIENLLKLERIPLERLEEKKELGKEQKKIWLDLNRKITNLRDSSKTLYSFQNPFDDKVAASSNESILTAVASRNAMEEKRDIKVVKIANADKFVSRPIPSTTKVEAGAYTFNIGEKEYKLNFGGGSIRAFSDYINRIGKDELHSSIINYDSDNIYFVIESKIEGSENRLSFDNKATDFALNIGIIKNQSSDKRDIEATDANVVRWTAPLEKTDYSIADGAITVKAGKELSLKVVPPVQIGSTSNMVLEMDVTLKNIPETAIQNETPPPSGPSIPSSGKIEFENIIIENSPFDVPTPKWTPPPTPPEKITDMGIFFLAVGGKIEKAPEIADTETTQKIEIPLSLYNGDFSALNIRNKNTYKDLTVSNIRVYNPNEIGDTVPGNAITTASDAVIEIDGIKLNRSSNTIDDIIPGVTLNLHSAGNQEVEIEIKPDAENIKSSIIEVVGYYNNLISELHILSRNNDEIISELTYLSEDEQEAARNRLGKLTGEFSITQMRDRLQRIVTNHYPGPDDNDDGVTILSQLGISTNTGSYSGGGQTKLRGYLEIDESKLDEAIATKSSTIKYLFGYDSDDDLAIDSGIAFETDQFLKAYNESGGIIATKTSTLDKSIARTDTEIINYNRKLERIEQDLKRKYGMMEGALQDLGKVSESLKNMGGNNNSR